jgi:hypothetical protein
VRHRPEPPLAAQKFTPSDRALSQPQMKAKESEADPLSIFHWLATLDPAFDEVAKIVLGVDFEVFPLP